MYAKIDLYSNDGKPIDSVKVQIRQGQSGVLKDYFSPRLEDGFVLSGWEFTVRGRNQKRFEAGKTYRLGGAPAATGTATVLKTDIKNRFPLVVCVHRPTEDKEDKEYISLADTDGRILWTEWADTYLMEEVADAPK